jgi:hypothetical protein
VKEKTCDASKTCNHHGRHHAFVRGGFGNQSSAEREGSLGSVSAKPAGRCLYRRVVRPGDPTKHASISNNGAFLTLTNESGSTSTGQLQGQTGIVAPEWQFVNGTLSPDGSQINWSNGTFWARCNTGGGGGHNRLNLTGTWYAQGDRSQSCSIRQRGKNLQLSNQSGDNASGQMDGGRHLTTNWNGNTIGGTVAVNGNRINWDNGTYWTRFRVYGSQNN